MSEISEQLQQDAARIHAVAGFLSSPMLVAQLCEAVQGAVVESQSPFVDRKGAALRWFCSPQEIDRVARAQSVPDRILTKYMRGGTPLFLKEEGDEAIRTGRWTPGKPSKVRWERAA